MLGVSACRWPNNWHKDGQESNSELGVGREPFLNQKSLYHFS